MKNYRSDLERINKMMIDAAVMIIKSDKTSQESKQDSIEYLRKKYLYSTDVEKEYILETYQELFKKPRTQSDEY